MASSSKESRQVAPPEPSIANPQLFKMDATNSQVVTYRTLGPDGYRFDGLQDLIDDTDIVIESIVKINNPFLKKAYLLKRAQRRLTHGKSVVEELLFHGTKEENLDSICTNNFNWRFANNENGQGVSFSKNAIFASNYSDKDSYHKVMIIAKVLIGRACKRTHQLIKPLNMFNTEQLEKGKIIVKFDDHEFLPMYKVYYHLEEDEKLLSEDVGSQNDQDDPEDDHDDEDDSADDHDDEDDYSYEEHSTDDDYLDDRHRLYDDKDDDDEDWPDVDDDDWLDDDDDDLEGENDDNKDLDDMMTKQ